jgi:hypothetical protein
MKLIIESWKRFLTEMGPTKLGSANKPCDKENPQKQMDYGHYLFHPYDPKRESEEWECNTAIEDQMLAALQHFIGSNDIRYIKGRVGEFIISKMKKVTDKSQPIYRITGTIPVYRGISLGLDDYGISFLENLPIKDAFLSKINGESYITYPATKKITYKMRRQFESFSYKKREADSFSKGGKSDSPLHIVFETFADKFTDGGGFFISFKNFYSLQDNPNEPLRSKWNRVPFDDVSRFSLEKEALLIGAKPGDEIPVVMVNLRLTNLLKLLPKLEQSDPNNPITIKLRNIIEYARKNAREYGSSGFKPGKQTVFENWRSFLTPRIKKK